jgi:hypothetical protein
VYWSEIAGPPHNNNIVSLISDNLEFKRGLIENHLLDADLFNPSFNSDNILKFTHIFGLFSGWQIQNSGGIPKRRVTHLHIS